MFPYDRFKRKKPFKKYKFKIEEEDGVAVYPFEQLENIYYPLLLQRMGQLMCEMPYKLKSRPIDQSWVQIDTKTGIWIDPWERVAGHIFALIQRNMKGTPDEALDWAMDFCGRTEPDPKGFHPLGFWEDHVPMEDRKFPTPENDECSDDSTTSSKGN